MVFDQSEEVTNMNNNTLALQQLSKVGCFLCEEGLLSIDIMNTSSLPQTLKENINQILERIYGNCEPGCYSDVFVPCWQSVITTFIAQSWQIWVERMMLNGQKIFEKMY